MTLPVVFTANGPSGYNLTKSVRLRGSATGYLNRTPASAGNQKTWTYSTWIKRGAVGAEGTLISGGATTGRLCVFFNSSGNLVSDVGGTGTFDQSVAVYRDPSAWYHFVWQFDTTQATAANRSRMYINGVQISLTQTRTFALNTDYQINNSVLQTLGTFSNSIGTYNFDGYQAETNFIDGQALTPSSFGSTNSLTGVWQPAKYTGTYGTNGFYLPFTNTTSTTTLGYDFSGNSNNWTTNNISLTTGSTYDSMTDVFTLTSATTANYCTWNPLDNADNSSITNGNLKVTNGGGDKFSRATMGLSSGKFYWEVLLTTVGNRNGLGITDLLLPYNATTPSGNYALVYVGWTGGGASQTSSSGTFSGTVPTFSNGDYVTFALDVSAGILYFEKNAAPNTSTSPKFTGLSTSSTYIPSCREPGGTVGVNNFNFGQQGFAYTPPTGFVALNTYNLPDSTIVKGNTVMDATLYTGTLLSNAVTNTAGFKPDLVWIKSRSAATDNKLTDSVRGTTKGLISNTTGAETTDTQGLTAFGTNGFTVGTNTDYNNLSATYVAWQWQAGQGTTSSNTSGSITSTVSVNASAGFSIVTYTGTGTNATVGHGLGVAPQVIIAKSRSATGNWLVYTAAVGNTSTLRLSSTAAADADIGYWNNTSPTSSVFTLGAGADPNANGVTCVAYCWTPIAGYSAFGSYTGNGSTDGTFVYTGFRPKFVLLKIYSGTTANWVIIDSARNTYNVANLMLNPDASDAEFTTTMMDFTANGFKLRTASGTLNGSGYNYIYMAFAENPFKNALAR